MQKSSAIQYYLFETSLHQKVADFSGILKKGEIRLFFLFITTISETLFTSSHCLKKKKRKNKLWESIYLMGDENYLPAMIIKLMDSAIIQLPTDR